MLLQIYVLLSGVLVFVLPRSGVRIATGFYSKQSYDSWGSLSEP